MAVTTLLATGTAPTSDRQVWASPVALRANWKNPITVRTGFETRIQQALTLSEQRRILRGTPRRSLSCTLTGTGRVETLAARQLLTRYTMAGFLMPLYSDQMELQATAAASATVLSVDPTYRRVFVGNRVLVLHTEHGVVTAFEVHVVDSISAGTSITLASPGLAAEAPRGSLVIPLFESRIIDSFSNGFVLTDDKADFQNFTAQEQVGPTQIDGIEAIGANPTGFDTFTSPSAGTLPVFAGPMDYSDIKFSLNRIGSISALGIGDLPVFYGERGVQQINALIQCLSRKEAWDTIRFFESRGGRAYPFWLRSPWSDYRVTGSNGNNLLVEDTGDLLDWNFRPYLVMQLSDGSFDYREIASVTQNGANHEVAFVGGAALGTIVDARQLFLVRMFRDEIAERWVTTEVCQMTLETVELLQEKQITMTETLAASDGSSIVTSPDGDLIGLGIGVSDDATTAISPDLALGGCDGPSLFPFIFLYNSTSSGDDNLQLIEKETGDLSAEPVTVTDNTLSFSTPTAPHGDTQDGYWIPDDGNAGETTISVVNTLTGAVSTITRGGNFRLAGDTIHRRVILGESGIVYSAQENTVENYLQILKYNANGTAAWSYTPPVGFEINTQRDVSIGRPAFGYLPVVVQETSGSSNHGLYVLNENNGTQFFYFSLGASSLTHGDCVVSLRQEGSVIYAYIVRNNPRSDWAGGGGGNYNIVKFNMTNGAFVWGYNSANATAAAWVNGKLFIFKGRGSSHAGQTTASEAISLNTSGSLVDEFAFDNVQAQLFDVDAGTGYLLGFRGTYNDFGVLDLNTGDTLWEAGRADYTFPAGFAPQIGSTGFMFRNSGCI